VILCYIFTTVYSRCHCQQQQDTPDY